MNRRRFAGLLVVGIVGAPLVARAQSAGRIPRVGVLIPGRPPTRPTLEAFRQGLRELGYVEGRNILLELRWEEEQPERWPELVAALVRSNVDVILAGTGQVVQIAKNATQSIPIVAVGVSNPVERGLVASLARPGGNLTGLTLLTAGLSGKRVQLLKEAVPRLRRVGIFTAIGTEEQVKETEQAARGLGIEPLTIAVRGAGDLDTAFRTAAQSPVGGVIVTQRPLFFTHRDRIAALALKHRLPTISGEVGFAEAGGLIEYGASVVENWRRAASYVDRILKGAKPGDLPMEQPTKVELVVNAKTAKALGLSLPPTLQARADRMIE